MAQVGQSRYMNIFAVKLGALHGAFFVAIQIAALEPTTTYQIVNLTSR